MFIFQLSRRAITPILVATFSFVGACIAYGTEGIDPTPIAWRLFSTQLQVHLQESLDAPDAIATRFKNFVLSHAKQADAVPPQIIVHLWVAADGTIQRLIFPPLADPHADGDLRQILSRIRIGARPPADMPQPVNLLLRLNLPRANSDQGAAPQRGDSPELKTGGTGR